MGYYDAVYEGLNGMITTEAEAQAELRELNEFCEVHMKKMVAEIQQEILQKKTIMRINEKINLDDKATYGVRSEAVLEEALTKKGGIEQAKWIARHHPFFDGNKRTAIIWGCMTDEWIKSYIEGGKSRNSMSILGLDDVMDILKEV